MTITAENTALILLAAGRSVRFGDRDKLAEPFLGKPLARHIITALEGVPFAARIAVCSGTSLNLEECGYRVVENDMPAEGQSRSVGLGVKAAREVEGVAAVLIALADMPRVTGTQIYRLIDAARDEQSIIASSDGVRPGPPAIFGAAHFDALEQLAGDEGGRALIRRGAHIVTSPAELVDIDTPEQLEALRVHCEGVTAAKSFPTNLRSG